MELRVREHTRTPECSTLTPVLVLWSFLFVFITPRAGQMQRSNYRDFAQQQTDQSEREKFTRFSKSKPNSLSARNALTPTQANPQALPSKEEKAAREKEPSETALFLLQRNWLAWSWTSGKEPKINGEHSVGINPRTAVLQSHPAVLLLRHFTARVGSAAGPRPWREDRRHLPSKYPLAHLTPRMKCNTHHHYKSTKTWPDLLLCKAFEH